MKVAKELYRKDIRYEIDLELMDTVLEKVGYWQRTITGDIGEYKVRDDVRKLKNFLQESMKTQDSVESQAGDSAFPGK